MSSRDARGPGSFGAASLFTAFGAFFLAAFGAFFLASRVVACGLTFFALTSAFRW